MTILEFIKEFSDEEKCKEYFRDVRMKQGVKCKKCGCTNHYWLQNKWQFQCKECSFRTTLRSGTIMENSRLPYSKYFLIILYMTSTKKGMSASEMQRQIRHQRYQTVWEIMHRVREVMGKRDAMYELTDMVEFDEGYFEIEVAEQIKKKLKRGKGSQRQANVAVMAESVPLEDPETGEIFKSCRFFKMEVLDTHKAETVDRTIKDSFSDSCIVFSDKSTSYLNISDFIEAHVVEKSSVETTCETLKWVHIAISNAKRNFLGVYHKIKGKHLQNYLNEFVYKLNRRYFKSIFERFIIAAVFPFGKLA